MHVIAMTDMLQPSGNPVSLCSATPAMPRTRKVRVNDANMFSYGWTQHGLIPRWTIIHSSGQRGKALKYLTMSKTALCLGNPSLHPPAIVGGSFDESNLTISVDL